MIIALDADLERLIADKIESGQYASPDEVISASLKLLEARDAGAENPPPESPLLALWEKISAISRQVPDEEWAKLPTDAASNPDKYLYTREKLVG